MFNIFDENNRTLLCVKSNMDVFLSHNVYCHCHDQLIASSKTKQATRKVMTIKTFIKIKIVLSIPFIKIGNKIKF